MLAPLSWLRAHAAVPELPAGRVAEALTRAGLKVEAVREVGAGLAGVVVGRVLGIEELTGFAKPIRYCQVDAGGTVRSVICGAANFAVGDVVALAEPGASLPGGVRIEASRRYGRTSEGMICSAAELGLGGDHSGILVLDPDLPAGEDVVAAAHLRDVVLDVEVTPDRGYALSIRGLARELATAFGAEFADPAGPPAAAAPRPADGGGHPVSVLDPRGCDRYVARRVGGVDPAARTPFELRRRLLLCGLRPISLPVDVTNIVLLELGAPLHAFDADRLSGGIQVRRAAAGERLVTLDGVDRALAEEDLVIADDSGPVALAGVMGGAATEVGPATTTLVLEAAHFAAAAVAGTARRHRLSTEASRRFERGVDDALAPAAAQAAAALLSVLGGAAAEPGVTDVDRRGPRPVIALPADLPDRLAGRRYGAAAVRRRLAEVGCGVRGDDPLEVTPPSWRPDLRRPVDLVEEVARLEGYDTVPATLPPVPAGRGLTSAQRGRRRVADALAAAGYVETPCLPFVAPEVLDDLGLAADDPRRRTVRVVNPISEAEGLLRPSLLPGLLAALRLNVSRGESDVALFETGQVFLEREGAPPLAPALPGGRRPTDAELAALDAALPVQPHRLATVLAGAWEPAGWWGPGRPAVWADAVAGAREAGHALRVTVAVRPGHAPPWHPGRCAELVVAGTVVGHAGELHPRVCEALALPARCCAMELDLDTLLAAAPDRLAAPRLSSFPAATVDVALLVARTTPAAEVAEALRAGAGPLLESLVLFDVYTGEQAGPDQRSLAYRLRLRALDRTLTAAEANAVRDAAVAEAARRVGARLRGA